MARIAYFESRASLNIYGWDLLPYLANHYEVDVYTDPCGDATTDTLSVYSFEDFDGSGDYAHLVFQLGNNSSHVPAYELLLTYGGVSVFHEVNLAGIVGARTLAKGKRLAFLIEVLRNEGVAPFVATSMNVLLHKRWPSETQYHMNRVACRRSEGVIVHNEQARAVLQLVAPQLPVRVVPMGVRPVDHVDVVGARRRLGLPEWAFIVVSPGVAAERKRIPQVLSAFARLVKQIPDALYLLVGRTVPGFDVEGLIHALDLTDHVRLTGWVQDDPFYDYIAAADVCVCLRYPVEGETSSVALRSMSYAKPTLVSDAGSMREFPDDICIKIKPDDNEVEAIYHAIYQLFQEARSRQALGERARAYTHRHHTWSAAAQAYYDFLESPGKSNKDCR